MEAGCETLGPVSVSPFDAELYLRMLGEYSLQQRESDRRSGGDPVATAGLALAEGRMVAVDAALQKSDWDLRLGWITVSDDATRVGVIGRADAGSRGHNPPPDLDVRLPDGRRTAARYNSGWGSSGLHGPFTLTDPVAPDTAWMEIEGHRVSLDAPAPDVTVSIERLPVRPSALSQLWQLLADFGNRHQNLDVEPAIDALLAAGAAEETDPQLEAIRWLTENGHGIHHRFGAMPSVGPGLPAGLPDAWRSLLSRRHVTGPRGKRLIGAVTPLFDGMSLAVNVLTSHGDGWELNVETVGVPHPHPHGSAFARRPLAWWAFDDRGGHYLGAMGSWSGGGPDHAGSGAISFQPLDPQASRLTIAPTGTTSRALIELELAWD